MVYKVCQRFDEIRGSNDADMFLDLVALGLIADMMSLKDFETHHLITKGIQNIRNPFFKGMIEKNSYSLGTDITPIGIAFYVAPYVNAITRVGQMEEKMTLFEAMLDWKAYESIPSTKRGCKGQLEQRVEQAVRNCTNVKSRQTKTRDQSLEAIENLIKENNLLDHKILIIKLEEFSVDRGLSGLIANQLMSKYQRPVIILNKSEDNGRTNWEGSARGYDKSKLKDFKAFVRKSNLAYLAEGHPNAFGFGITEENFDAFVSYSDAVLADMDFAPSYRVDFIYDVNNFKSKDILAIGSLKYLWGQDVDEAYIAVEGIKISKDNLILMAKDKNPTLKITLPNGVACLKFKSSEEEYNDLYSESGCVIINAVGKCEINKFNGMVTPQIIIENYDIVKRQEYYF